jgi:aldehyde:ferredoxin oxidoreductase
LGSLSAKEETLPDELVRDCLGGAGFAIKCLYGEVKPRTPALSVDNKLIFADGPLTGAVGMALSGGQFPAAMKHAGYDMVIAEGRAEKPTFISINNGEVRFRSAAKLDGMMTTDTQLFIKEMLSDQNCRAACIGPAGTGFTADDIAKIGDRVNNVARLFNIGKGFGRKDDSFPRCVLTEPI